MLFPNERYTMSATPYTDELLAIANAGIDCKLEPQQIFRMASAHARSENPEREERMSAFRSLAAGGMIHYFVPPAVEEYEPHTPFIYNWTRQLWREKINSGKLAL